MDNIIIDATGLVLGRMLSIVAKKAMLGASVDIVNCEKAVVTGDRYSIFAHYELRRQRGTWSKGPFLKRSPDAFVKRTLRGMLPYKRLRGKEAYKHVNAYIGMPDALKDKKAQTLKESHVSKMMNVRYITVGEICKHLGGKV